jgi:hypothetical protein
VLCVGRCALSFECMELIVFIDICMRVHTMA